ncbi:MAG: hypothetical protein AAGJ83_14015 [Planctomycetota bacterium]
MTDSESSEAQQWIAKEDVDSVWMLAFSELIGDRQLDLVSSHFGFSPVESAEQVQVGAVYLYRRSEQCTLVILEEADDTESFLLTDLQDGANRVEITASGLIGLSEKRRLVLLLKRQTTTG